MSEAEYEVECITRARVVKVKRKIKFEFLVHWKGYLPDEDTWEPLESFSGSTRLVDAFWSRVNHDGRDYRDMKKFQLHEEFSLEERPKRHTEAQNMSQTNVTETISGAKSGAKASPRKSSKAKAPTSKRKAEHQGTSPSTSRKRQRREVSEVPDSEPERERRHIPALEDPSTGIAVSEPVKTDDHSVALGNTIPVKRGVPRGGESPLIHLQKTKNTSSLLTFDKHGPKTIKGKYSSLKHLSVTPMAREDPISISPVAGSSGAPIESNSPPTVVMDDSPGLDDETGNKNDGPSNSSIPAQVATDDLSDFEDDGGTGDDQPTMARSSLSLNGLKESTLRILPSWSNTIFGPMWAGSQPVGSSPSSTETASLVFNLPLGSASSLPVLLHLPDTRTSDMLQRLTKQSTGDPPGKMYNEEYVHALLNCVRCEGYVATVTLNSKTPDEAQGSFQELVKRLQLGQMFVCAVGPHVLAMCAASCSDIVQRLNVPPAILQDQNALLITPIIIESNSRFAEVATHAQNAVW